MSIVMDCSVAASFLLEDERHPYSLLAKQQLGRQDVFVPQLFWLEIGNLLLYRERRKLFTPEQSAYILSGLSELPFGTEETPQFDLWMPLARQHKLTSYDASYLALAKRKKAKLATLDEALKKAAISENLFYNPAP